MADFSEKSIRISPPVAGRYFLSAQYPDTLDKKGELTIDNTFDVPGLFGITYERKVYWLYVKPGENIELSIDKNHKERPLTLQVGSFPEAQEAFNRLELGAALGQNSQQNSHDSDFERISEQVGEEMVRQLAPFDELYKLGKMDEDFYEIVQSMVKNHYAEVLCHALVDETASLIYHPDSSGYNRGLIDRARKNWDFIFAIADYRDVKSSRVPSYAGFYHTGYYHMVREFYIDSFLPKSEGRELSRGRKTMADYYQNRYWNIRDHHSPGPLQEYLFASQIHFINSKQNYYDFAPYLYADFTARYPNSMYIPYLKPAVDEVIAFHRKLQEDKGGDYRFMVGDNHYGDFEQFLKQYFPDKTVYIDLWATWCVPCKEEFQFSDQLHDFVDSRGISVLYISIDKDVDASKWKEMITYYDLKGYHIRASASLLSNLQKRIYKSNALTIPRYILVRNGKILEDNMKRPSAINRLYAQIDELISMD